MGAGGLSPEPPLGAVASPFRLGAAPGVDAFVDYLRERAGCTRILRIDLAPGGPTVVDLPVDALRGAVVHVAGVLEHLRRPEGCFALLRRALDTVPLAVVDVARVDLAADWTPPSLIALLDAAGFRVAVAGWTPGPTPHLLALLDGNAAPDHAPAPAGFRVVAILKTFNEVDIIVPCIERLARGGVDVYVVDNWSTDGTWDLVRSLVGRGVVGVERFPERPGARYSWRELLKRTEILAHALDADWFIHHDADEVRTAPWPGVRLRDAIYRVGRSGFNAIDHTVIEFHPVDDDYRANDDFERHFRHYDFVSRPGAFIQIKTWRRTAAPVVLHESGGHEAQFPGRRIYPFKFLVKHYPIRSQAHGLRKVLRERRARWDPAECAVGWHSHYDRVRPGHCFLRDVATLERFDDDTFHERYLVERLSGVCIRRA